MLRPVVIGDAWSFRGNEAEMTSTQHYSLTVAEHLDEHWSSWFDGLTITHHSDGTSTLAGPIRDQSALYGLIDKSRDLGLTLLAVGRAAPQHPPDESGV